MSSWKPFALDGNADIDNDLSTSNLDALYRVAHRAAPDEPDRQALIVALAVILHLDESGLEARLNLARKAPA